MAGPLPPTISSDTLLWTVDYFLMQQRANEDLQREDRLLIYYERLVQANMRSDASDTAVRDAADMIQDPRLPRLAVEFRLDDSLVPSRWALVEGLGAAFEKYVLRLCEMENVRFRHSVIVGLTDQHRSAFDGVIEAATALEALGWPVNWEQNVQAILESTEFGMRDGKLVDRFQEIPEHVVLGDELLLLGTLTFHRQVRSAEGGVGLFDALVLSPANAGRYKVISLHLISGDKTVPNSFRYASDWIAWRSGKSFRIAV